MTRNFLRLEAALAHKDFPLWVLAAVGVLVMPSHWSMFVFAVMIISLVYGYLKRNPGTLADTDCWKRPEVQRFGLLSVAWFWWWLLTSAYQANGFAWFPVTNAGMFSLIFMPLLAYTTVAVQALAAWPKNVAASRQIDDLKKVQRWTHATFGGFLGAFVFSVVGIVWFPCGIGSWLCDWFICSGRDATLPGMQLFTAKTIEIFGTRQHPIVLTFPSAGDWFGQFVNCLLALIVTLLLWRQAVRLAGFLTMWIKGLSGRFPFPSKIQESLTQTVRMPRTYLTLKETHIFSKNVARSLAWIIVCYLTLFGLIGFSTGPLGGTIVGWLNACMVDAYLKRDEYLPSPSHPPHGTIVRGATWLRHGSSLANAEAKAARLEPVRWPMLVPRKWPVIKDLKMAQQQLLAERPQWLALRQSVTVNPNLRLFCAAIFALYGTVPLAVTGVIFLPYGRRRKLVLNKEGVFFPDGPYLALGFRALRLWSDFASIDVIARDADVTKRSGKLTINFHSGGKFELDLAQLENEDLEKFLSAVDENALQCTVSDRAIDFRTKLQSELSRQRNESEVGYLAAQQFQSTIFVPHQPGSWLPDGETRVVRLLASRPLSCVYLVRTEEGKLAIAKQFFLADDNEETQTLRKCFKREYELLSTIDHPAISKILSVFHRDQSTYLLLEHGHGTDLRRLIAEQGPRSQEKVIEWGMQICDIMTYLHGLDPPIIHRDLTPDNLVLTEEGSIRIIDFGAAHQFLEGITGTIIGKQCYVPPEQLQGRAGVKSDIYSFGCMVYCLLTGQEPLALTQCDPRSKADVSPELSALVMACTAFDDSLRPDSFARVKEFLIAVREKPRQELIDTLKEVARLQGVTYDLAQVQRQSKAEAQTGDNLGVTNIQPHLRLHQAEKVQTESSEAAVAMSLTPQSNHNGVPILVRHFQPQPKKK